MSRIPESSKITSHNTTNSVIVRLPGKQYLKSVSVIIILTLLEHRFLKKEECSKTILLEKVFISLFHNSPLIHCTPKGPDGGSVR